MNENVLMQPTRPGEAHFEHQLALARQSIVEAAEQELAYATKRPGRVRDVFTDWLYDEFELTPDEARVIWDCVVCYFVTDMRREDSDLWREQFEKSTMEIVQSWH